MIWFSTTDFPVIPYLPTYSTPPGWLALPATPRTCLVCLLRLRLGWRREGVKEERAGDVHYHADARKGGPAGAPPARRSTTCGSR